jgi:hypothetical protein
VSRLRLRHAVALAIALLALAVPVAVAAFVATISNSGSSFQAASIFPGAIKMATGSYTGNGSNGRAISVGFQPDVVIVKSMAATEAVTRTSTMSGDASKPFATAVAFQANYIESLTTTGFTVGTDSRVNAATTTYHWVAFKANAQAMRVGSYSGNGTSQSFTGFGFSPELVIVFGNNAQRPVLRANGMSRTFRLDTATGSTTGVTAFGADGFSVGNSAEVNSFGVAYHYVAFNDVADSIDVGSYTGNGSDNRDITTPAFQPEYLLLRADDNVTARPAGMKPSSLAGDSALGFLAFGAVSDRIQALQPNGFQLGTGTEVNASTVSYHYLAVRSSAP